MSAPADPVSLTALGSALLAAGAVGLLVPGPFRMDRARTAPSAPSAVRLVLAGGLALGLLALLTAPVLSTRAAATLAVLAVAGAGLVGLARRRRARRSADAARARVLDMCQLLAAELGAGRPPGAALERAAVEWPTLEPVAAAHRLGGEVPAALRALSARPGHADLLLLAAAWQVSQASGGGLAAALQRLAGGVRAAQATGRVVQAELASARSTARLMAGLPVLSLVMGGGLGGDPIGFLLGTPLGLACLAGGVLLQLAGLAWIEAIAGAVAEAT